MSLAHRLINRRNFIIESTGKVVLSGALGHSLLSNVAAKNNLKEEKVIIPVEQKEDEPLPPEKRVGYALVGIGKLTQEELLPAFAQCKKSKLVALVSGDRSKALRIAGQYGVKEGNIYDYANFDSIKDNKEVDVIYIVLPNGMHAEYTVRGAKAGKHILCEKPMANTAKECEEMISACKKANVKLMIAYRIQYEPNNALIKSYVRSQKFGPVKVISATNAQVENDPKAWRLNKKLAGGGSLPDIGLYCINTIRYLTGEEPSEVFGRIYNTPDGRFREVEDTVLFDMYFPSGIQANCMTSYSSYASRYYRINAEKGWFGMDPAFAYHGLKVYQTFVSEGKEVEEWPDPDKKNQFALEIDHMSDVVLQNKTPYTPGEEGLQDQKIMEAIYRSAAENKPVKLELITSLDTFRGK